MMNMVEKKYKRWMKSRCKLCQGDRAPQPSRIYGCKLRAAVKLSVPGWSIIFLDIDMSMMSERSADVNVDIGHECWMQFEPLYRKCCSWWI